MNQRIRTAWDRAGQEAPVPDIPSLGENEESHRRKV